MSSLISLLKGGNAARGYLYSGNFSGRCLSFYQINVSAENGRVADDAFREICAVQCYSCDYSISNSAIHNTCFNAVGLAAFSGCGLYECSISSALHFVHWMFKE